MGRRCKLVLIVWATIFLFATTAHGQDPPSLGDLARQQRQQKEAEQTKSASRVVTDEEIPEHTGPEPTVTSDHREHGTSIAASSNGTKQSAERWKSQIQAQKAQIASLQAQLDKVNQSIRFAPHECAGPRCVQWNERQREKQQRVERMQTQIQEQKKRLEEMQESARKQGYGNSVYEP
jgi:predicted RNase H-like nuclease (RuvC/YqgF family)